MRKFKFLTLLSLLLAFAGVYAQEITSQGVILDKKSGDPLIGATVLQKETNNGTITDIDGMFRISVPRNAVLVVSYIGYVSQNVTANGTAKLRIELSQDTEMLDEVIVVGYGSQKAKDMTAPISTVKGSDLSKQIAANPMSALQGKMSGVQIVNNGAPGAGPSVKIRGVGSIGDFANPLYVVDGVFVDNIDFLSSSDIEDLTVLKDASAAAIYGVRAANGVVMITTRKGKINQTNISYDGYVGVQIPTNVMKLSNTDQYVTLINEANANNTNFTPMYASMYPASIDWYSVLMRNAITHNHALDISGATDQTSYSIGVNYFYQEGIMKATNDYERLNFRSRFDQKVNDWLKVGFNIVYSDYNKNIANNEAFFKAFVSPPVYSIYDENNSLAYPEKFGSPQQFGFGAVYANPYAIAFYNDNRQYGNKTILSTFAEVSLIKNILKFKTAYNADLNSLRSINYLPEYFVGGSQGQNQSSMTKGFEQSYRHIIDNVLTYSNSINKNSFSFMLGQSTRLERKFLMTGSALNIPRIDDASMYLSLGSVSTLFVSDNKDIYSYNGLSYFTRATYNYDDKYLATFTFRADGSSKYQEKWGYFPSLGLAWNVTNEDFMKNQKTFENLKFRTSWGMLGNDNIPANSGVILGLAGIGASSVFGDNHVYDGVGAQTVIQNVLKWEIVKGFNAGFDFTFNKKLSGELDYYNRTTYNSVFYAPISSGGGVANLLGNWGTIQNQGVELTLSWKNNITKDLSYNIGFNATTIDNKVLSLDGKRDFIPDGYIRGSYTTRTAVGHPIGSFYGYEIAGVYATQGEALRDPVSQTIMNAGYFKYKDQNGDNLVDDHDKVYLGSALPWLTTGLDFGMNYKNLDLSLTLQGQFGNKILNAKRMNRDIFTDGNYDLDFFENRWTTTNHSTTYPSPEAYNSSFTQQANTFFVEDGSYVRIQNIQMGYNFNNIKGFKLIRVYLSAQRPFTYFTYKGFTPEVSGGPTTNGIDVNTYPMQAIYTAGLKINF